MCVLEAVHIYLGGVTEKDNKGTPEGVCEQEIVKWGGSARSMHRGRWCAWDSVQWGGQGKKRQGSAEGVVATASATGPVPKVGAGPGPRVGGSD